MPKRNAQIAGLPRTDRAAPEARRRPEDHKLPLDAASIAFEHAPIMSCRLTG
jgi:hypothetical protein